MTFKFAPEGYPYFAFFGGLAVVLFLIGGVWAALLPVLLTLFMFYFFRDPDRRVPEGDNSFVAPADGRVILIQSANGDACFPQRSKQISIFMSPLNVHVNRAPCDGTVESVVHRPGTFVSAFKPEASLRNEQISLIMKGPDGSRLQACQVAGAVARRAVCRVKAGDALRKGQRYGIIKFSSRVDLYLPEETEITVKLGDRVTAGETVVGIKSTPRG